jgi:hypothetical protein
MPATALLPAGNSSAHHDRADHPWNTADPLGHQTHLDYSGDAVCVQIMPANSSPPRNKLHGIAVIATKYKPPMMRL